MRDMLREANLAVNKAREASAAALAPDELAAFVDRYWAAVRLGLAFHRGLPKLETKAKPGGRTKQRPGHNLLERLKTFKPETLYFSLEHRDLALQRSDQLIDFGGKIHPTLDSDSQPQVSQVPLIERKFAETVVFRTHPHLGSYLF